MTQPIDSNDPSKETSAAEPRPQHPRRLRGRKLLVASIGVATVRYVVACTPGFDGLLTTSANLLAPPPMLDAGVRDAGKPSAELDGGEDSTELDAGDADDAGHTGERDGR